MSTHAPLRTCVGCRAKAQRSALVRLVVDRRDAAPAVTIDHTASAPGRGAWVHQIPHCLDRALTTGAIPRGLRTVASVDMSKVTAWFHTIRR